MADESCVHDSMELPGNCTIKVELEDEEELLEPWMEIPDMSSALGAVSPEAPGAAGLSNVKTELMIKLDPLETTVSQFEVPLDPSEFSTPSVPVSEQMMDAVDVDDLIAEVRKRSPLYDTTLKEYHDGNRKKKLWRQICRVIYTPAVWDELSSTEKIKYGKSLVKKWASLRRGFRKELALQNSEPFGSGAKKKARETSSRAVDFFGFFSF